MSKKMYAVQVPPSNPDSYTFWHNVIDFDTREEAIAYIKRVYGGDDEGRVPLLSEVE
jgi:hypothetical protein